VQWFLLFFSFFITNSNAQVAPNYKPYSLINPENRLTSKELIIEIDEIDLNFRDNAQMNIFPDGIVYRLSIHINGKKSGHLSISDWNIPEGAMLFIFNDLNSYTGPYLTKESENYISSRFLTENITLEYYVPVNALFMGNFKIDKILSDYSIPFFQKNDVKKIKIKNKRERPKIMVTGYWPPTNEMVRHFSQDLELNPVWQGDNWEGRGYDVVSFFPQFEPADCNNCGQGYGELEVDYQDFSQDFWPIVDEIHPIGIITFSRGFNDMSWELENRLVNLHGCAHLQNREFHYYHHMFPYTILHDIQKIQIRTCLHSYCLDKD
jgi:hypothetical protein